MLEGSYYDCKTRCLSEISGSWYTQGTLHRIRSVVFITLKN